ncbi:MAG: Sterol 24-C-methyltransferase [Candidatus Collierbacteria bacterium GW2011_GWC2_43_12]|uniref:Sterol 24-C-methyltransferase n=1 Tax=Candidatus Collierbacteria bacterium GW2011_GWC2_43_12 TaxID=1618390 RepID=A0A0G1FI13_9BACT|nr:MAG: Sterol 24-C-methyltransferase [Candidatus Collierbacteria bacterium GW2011_GWC2_43_12]KKT83925.1 MAG: Sterol 24-C-methyltransferase [Microgenomates group bacterium GW2011_GWC1_44_9]
MKQVSSRLYDKDFFNRVYGQDNSADTLEENLSKEYYKEMVSLVKLTPENTVVDFGCGNGNLSFMLWKKYRCRVVGIDYSKAAVDICRDRQKKYEKKYGAMKIEFLCANNNHLPKLKNIRAVYLCDVVEHMYDSEIRKVLKSFQSWSNNLQVVIHTDNNIYLKFIRPILNLINVIMRNSTLSEVIRAENEEKKVHVNLTNPNRLKKTMYTYGLTEGIRMYPPVTPNRISAQLGALSKVPYMVNLVRNVVKSLPFLSPSFYAVFLYTHTKNGDR